MNTADHLWELARDSALQLTTRTGIDNDQGQPTQSTPHWPKPIVEITLMPLSLAKMRRQYTLDGLDEALSLIHI